jgi:hypothetical protein
MYNQCIFTNTLTSGLDGDELYASADLFPQKDAHTLISSVRLDTAPLYTFLRREKPIAIAWYRC